MDEIIEIPKYIVEYWNSQSSNNYFYISDTTFVESVIEKDNKFFVGKQEAEKWIKSFKENAFNENSEKSREKVMYLFLKKEMDK